MKMAEAESNNIDATNNPNSIEAGDEDDRKLFVGGLPQDATQDDIWAHFSTFGEIDNINLKTDPNSGRSRGFAFVLYKTVQSLNTAIDAKEHTVKSKEVAVKKALAKHGKIYVGKLKPELTDQEIKEHFETFGSIVNVEQPFDKTRNERKNFCFITFEKEEAAKQLLKIGTTTINGVELDIKRVTVKDPLMGGGMGRGRGGYPGYGYGYYGAGYGYDAAYLAAGYAGGWAGYPAYGGYGGVQQQGYKNGYGGRGGGQRGRGNGGGRGRGGHQQAGGQQTRSPQ